ncbi:hypothetical protein [Chryseobacterium sp. MMS23-Vi53]|uniref:hypothetical protein n=1 Tax=Chryseobacterium sp. MMS23-Vi53 TaxID=3386644 RepID=UPI0039ED7EBB
MRATFSREEYDIAIQGWSMNCGNYSTIQNLIPTNYVFYLGHEEIEWLNARNENPKFCVEMGLYENQVIIILAPLDAAGQKIPMDDYCYAPLQELESDLTLTETEEYVLVKNAVLSKELTQVDNSSNMSYPIANQPMLEQDKALDAIESWRTEAMSWFYRECDEFKGARIFKKFFVPAQDLLPSKPGFTHAVCSFGLKFSDVYQRMLPTLIFISFYEDIENTGSIQATSNTYDWSQACPPLCG